MNIISPDPDISGAYVVNELIFPIFMRVPTILRQLIEHLHKEMPVPVANDDATYVKLDDLAVEFLVKAFERTFEADSLRNLLGSLRSLNFKR
jgi:hypothetical protein